LFGNYEKALASGNESDKQAVLEIFKNLAADKNTEPERAKDAEDFLAKTQFPAIFDQAYESQKKLNPALTRKDFANEFYKQDESNLKYLKEHNIWQDSLVEPQFRLSDADKVQEEVLRIEGRIFSGKDPIYKPNKKVKVNLDFYEQQYKEKLKTFEKYKEKALEEQRLEIKRIEDIRTEEVSEASKETKTKETKAKETLKEAEIKQVLIKDAEKSIEALLEQKRITKKDLKELFANEKIKEIFNLLQEQLKVEKIEFTKELKNKITSALHSFFGASVSTFNIEALSNPDGTLNFKALMRMFSPEDLAGKTSGFFNLFVDLLIEAENTSDIKTLAILFKNKFFKDPRVVKLLRDKGKRASTATESEISEVKNPDAKKKDLNSSTNLIWINSTNSSKGLGGHGQVKASA